MSSGQSSGRNRYSDEERASRKADREPEVEIFVPARTGATVEPFKPRALEELTLPLPRHPPRHWWSGEPDYGALARQFEEVTRVAEAQRGLREAATRLEVATQECERTKAGRQQLPKLVEMDALQVDMALMEARDKLAEKQARHHRRPLERQRDRELDELDYETALARKRKELAEQQAVAGRAEVDAQLAERVARAQAEAKAFKQEGDREEARAAAEKHRAAREEEAQARLVAQKEGLPPEMARHLQAAQRRRHYDNVAEAKVAEILAGAGGDESALSDEQSHAIEEWREAAARSKADLDKAGAAVEFPLFNGKDR